jgi:transcriptional regulator with XRE-family HTH domain
MVALLSGGTVSKEESAMKIGARLRELRLQKHLSFAAIASQIGVTRSFLSMIEKDKTAPSITTLVKILNVLDVKLSDFFREIEKPSGIVLKKDELTFFQDVKTKIRFASLSKSFPSPRMESFYFELEPGSVSDLYASQKQVFLYMLEGRIELEMGGEHLLLAKGDSIYFDAAAPHLYKAAGRRKAAAIIVSSGTAGNFLDV